MEKKKSEHTPRGGYILFFFVVPGSVTGTGKQTAAHDVEGTVRFLTRAGAPGFNGDEKQALRTIDVGCGVGRTAIEILARRFQKVDLLEPCVHLLDAAREGLERTGRMGTAWLGSLQDFDPSSSGQSHAPPKYDLVFVQWCLLYLVDEAVAADALRRLAAALDPHHGRVFVKENVPPRGQKAWTDPTDASVTRTDTGHRRIFARAGLRIVARKRQTPWPSSLCPVVMYLLAPTD